MSPQTNQVTVTTQTYDLIYVDINNDSFLYQSFEYVIYSPNNTMLRRGQFRSPCVQIRTSNLEEGTYHFQLLLNGQEWRTTHFEKRSPEA